jgi:AraC-like DNA-binding protein
MGSQAAIQVGATPAPGLRPYVASYVGFEISGFPAGVHLGVPGRALTAVITLSEPLEIAPEPTPAALPRRRFSALTGGLATRPVAIRHDGTFHGVKLSLTPLGARAVYGMPAAELANDVVALDDLLGPLGVELVYRLQGGTTWGERFAALDDLLLRAVHQGEGGGGAAPMRPEIAEAWRRLVVTMGQTRIDLLAADLGWSRRHLTRQFRRELGLAPKTMARILRFEHAHLLATVDDPPSWADVSNASGYADQAHLLRDWREFTGHSPQAWRRADVLVEAGRQMTGR